MTRALLVASGLVFLFGATAGARTAPRASRPRTLATLDVPVHALAQNGRRIALIATHLRCGNQVRILTLPERRPLAVGSRRGRSCEQLPLHTVAVAGDGRALWQAVPGAGNTLIDVDLYTAVPRGSATHVVAAVELSYNEGDPDHIDSVPFPVATDGSALVFYARCDNGLFEGSLRSCGGEGAIYRLVGFRARLLTKVARAPVGVAVTGRRVAAVTNNALCCNDTPVWSHDGKRLAWIHRGDLWTINADGTGDRRLAKGASLPSWSPDGAQLVFQREEARKQRVLYRVDATGRGLRRLTAGTAPAWSPDGTRIAFIRGKDVYVIDPAGRVAMKLTKTAGETAGPLSWSPDSTRIAVTRGGFVSSLRADATSETRLARGGQPAWSPNGARIAFGGAHGIGIVNSDGTGAVRVTSPRDEEDLSPTWSPDSSRIAFIRGGFSSGGVDGKLWVANADGSRQRRLAPSQRLVSPQWAPSGESIAAAQYYSYEDGDLPYHAGIRLVSPANGKATRFAPALHATVVIRDALTGRQVERFAGGGHARAIALGADYVALLAEHGGLRVDLYNRNGSLRAAAVVPLDVDAISAGGRSVVFATRRVIRRVDARTGRVSTLASARGRLVGATVHGHRVVWAENSGGRARIRAVTAP